MAVLVTGAAGFIGFHVCKRLLSENPDMDIVGIDNLNDYYEVSLKEDRLKQLEHTPNFTFHKLALEDRDGIAKLFAEHNFEYVIHLGAQAGVRYSLENPHAYADSNLIGHLNILEGCRNAQTKHLVYASSSSVYGMNTKMPFSTTDSVDHPVSLYAATKKANELMSHSYSHLYDIPTTGLRFFTVYGSWGRPDMAPMIFAKAILNGEPSKVNNHGDMQRDFTHVSDIVEGIIRLRTLPPKRTENWTPETGSPGTSSGPYRIYNIGAGKPTSLMDFISELESALGVEAIKDYRAMQPGDVPATWAETEDLFKAIDYRPQFSLKEGIPEFVAWYKSYYG
ncbi:MAG: NAD-dependent epimerase [Idiomarina sp.]|nr:NAD-dependent epimerase [Idiomarina sp.]